MSAQFVLLQLFTPNCDQFTGTLLNCNLVFLAINPWKDIYSKFSLFSVKFTAYIPPWVNLKIVP